MLQALSTSLGQAPLPTPETVEVVQGQVLQDAAMPSTWIYFPESAQLSLQAQLKGQSTRCTELALVGSSAAAGLLHLGGSASPGLGAPLHRCIVVRSGSVCRVHAQRLLQQAQTDMRLWRALMRCNESMTHLMAHTALCNTQHSVVQSLCRWLLLLQEPIAAQTPVLPLQVLRTVRAASDQEFAQSVQQLVDVKAVRLQDEHIAVLDPQALVRCSCNCYETIQRSTAQWFHRQ
jgi:hypothetical protein